MIAARPASRHASHLPGSKSIAPAAVALGTLLVLTAMLGWMLASDGAARFPMAAVSAAVFALAVVAVPSARLGVARPLSPRGWLMMAFGLQIVVCPALAVFLGPYRGQLPHTPPDLLINAAMLIDVLAFVSALAGLALADARSRAASSPTGTSASRVASDRPHALMVTGFFGAGLLGLWLQFGDLQGLVDYFVGSGKRLIQLDLQSRGGATPAQAAATFLLPFLGFAFVLVWCRQVEALRQTARRFGAYLLLTLTTVAAVLSYLLFHYNRGAAFVPLVAMAAAFSARYRRIPLTILWVVAALVMLGAVGVGGLREQRSAAVTGAPYNGGVAVTQQIQVYGEAPQFLAFMIDVNHNGGQPTLGRELAASAVSSIPILGRDARPSSTIGAYNRALYGDEGTIDQYPPFVGELAWSFGLPGVVLGFLLVGWSIGRLQRRFEHQTSVLGTLTLQYAAVWVAFLVIGSVGVVSQIAVFYSWPLVVSLVLTRIAARVDRGVRHSPRGPRPPSPVARAGA